MRRILCALTTVVFFFSASSAEESFYTKTSLKELRTNNKNINGEELKLRLDNFISISNSEPQQNQDLFFEVNSERFFEFNSLNSKWDMGSRYSELEGFQIWIKEFNTNYKISLENFKTDFGVRVGRFYFSDLKMDSLWSLGFVESQFRGNPLQPISQGLTGLSLWTKLGDVKISLFGSFISFPDSGPNFKIVDGQIVSSSPWFPNAPTTVTDQDGDRINLSYNLDISNRLDILLKPSLISKIDAKVYGIKMEVMGGLMASNQFFLEVEPKGKVDSSNNAFIDADVTPSLLSKTFMAMKLSKEIGGTNFWSEYYTENHIQPDQENSDLIYNSKVFDQTYFSLGIESLFDLSKYEVLVGTSYLRNITSEELDFENDFNFLGVLFRNAFTTYAKVHHHPTNLEVSFDFKYDINDDVFQFSPRLSYQSNSKMQLYTQYDLIGENRQSSTDGFLSNQSANDRFSVGLSYAL